MPSVTPPSRRFDSGPAGKNGLTLDAPNPRSTFLLPPDVGPRSFNARVATGDSPVHEKQSPKENVSRSRIFASQNQETKNPVLATALSQSRKLAVDQLVDWFEVRHPEGPRFLQRRVP